MFLFFQKFPKILWLNAANMVNIHFPGKRNKCIPSLLDELTFYTLHILSFFWLYNILNRQYLNPCISKLDILYVNKSCWLFHDEAYTYSFKPVPYTEQYAQEVAKVCFIFNLGKRSPWCTRSPTIMKYEGTGHYQFCVQVQTKRIVQMANVESF